MYLDAALERHFPKLIQSLAYLIRKGFIDTHTLIVFLVEQTQLADDLSQILVEDRQPSLVLSLGAVVRCQVCGYDFS